MGWNGELQISDRNVISGEESGGCGTTKDCTSQNAVDQQQQQQLNRRRRTTLLGLRSNNVRNHVRTSEGDLRCSGVGGGFCFGGYLRGDR